MSQNRTLQGAVNWGEISPSFYGRTDLPQYRAGCSTMRNMVVLPQGGAMSRAGTKYCGQCLESADEDSVPPEFVPFTYNVTEAYALEFGDEYMRVLYHGAYVTEDSITVSTATNAAVGVFTTPIAHGFSTTDWVYLTGFTGMTEVNGHTYAINTTPTTGSFTLKSTLTGTALDTSAFGVYGTSSGTVARIFTLDTPYAIEDVHTLKYAQDDAVMSITHPLYKPHDLERVEHNDWTLTTTSFTASITPPLNVTATPSTTTAATVSTRYVYQVTAVDAETGEESIASNLAGVTNSVNISLTLGSCTLTWSSVTGAAYYNLYKGPASYAVDTPAGPLFGYMATSYGLSFVDTNIVPDFTITPPRHYNPFATSSILFYTITATGSAYTTSNLAPPLVAVQDPVGSGFGATGFAVVQSGGVFAIVPTFGGEGYLSASVIISSAGGGTGATFAATAGTASKWFGGVTVLTSGSGYPSGVVLIANYIHPITGNPMTKFSTTSTVGGGGGITAAAFDLITIADHRPLAATVSITVYGGSGVGAAATAEIGPATGTFPSVVAYFDQRRFYANTLNEPDTYWGSQPGAYTNMDRSLPITDSDAIVGKPWAQQVNGIQWMIPMPGGLVILTGKNAWQLNGGTGGSPITPANQSAQAQAYNGVSPDVAPITINYDILYVQQEGSIVRDLSYSLATNIYTGTDMTVMSNHLFDDYTIERWDWSEERYKVVWAVRSDGKGLSLSYLKEQNIYAWARHDTRGLLQSVCCVTEPPVNAPYFIVKRYIPGASRWAYFAERMDNRLWTDIEDAWCLDCALAYPQTEPEATLVASSATGDGNIGSYLLIDGGANYTAPIASVVDAAGTGSGASVSLSVSGGVIISASVVAQGEDYTGPCTLQILDATGSGAVITPVVTNYVTLSATTASFTASDVGDIIRMGGGKLEVVAYVSSTTVSANIIAPITSVVPNDPDNRPLPAAPGEWTIATPVSTVSGLDHLEGMTVSALADGGVVEDLTVEGGAVTLPMEASKIVVGLPFTVQMQTLYLESQQGTVQGRRKTPFDTVLRVFASRAPQVGANQPDSATQPNQATVDWSNMAQVQERTQGVPAGQAVPLYTGDYFTNVAANWDDNAQVAVQQTKPLPLTVLALAPNWDVGDS